MLLHAPNLDPLPWLMHAFSTRQGGDSTAYGGRSLNLGFTRDDSRSAVLRNRAALLEAAGAEGWPLVTLRQVHSDHIHHVTAPAAKPLTGDGLITDTPRLALAVQVADCLPIVLADTRRRAVGIFHAGWRGTLKRIVEKGLGLMRLRFGTQPGDVRAALGPGIHACCYQVGRELREQFDAQFAYASELFHEVYESDPVREKYPLLFMTARAPGHGDHGPRLHLDLVAANRRQLSEAGVPAEAIYAAPECTSCRRDLLFSYRAEKGRAGRMMGVVGIRS